MHYNIADPKIYLPLLMLCECDLYISLSGTRFKMLIKYVRLKKGTVKAILLFYSKVSQKSK